MIWWAIDWNDQKRNIIFIPWILWANVFPQILHETRFQLMSSCPVQLCFQSNVSSIIQKAFGTNGIRSHVYDICFNGFLFCYRSRNLCVKLLRPHYLVIEIDIGITFHLNVYEIVLIYTYILFFYLSKETWPHERDRAREIPFN